MATGESKAVEAVRVGTTVPLDVRRAFDLFTDGIGTWWPFQQFSYSGGRTRSLHLEPRQGGRFVEGLDDGSELVDGVVLTVQAPERIVFTYRAPTYPADTEVEATFSGRGGETDVEVEHRGWERLGAEAREERDGHTQGWSYLLGLYRQAAGG